MTPRGRVLSTALVVLVVVGILALAGLNIESLAILNILTTALIAVVLSQAWSVLGGYGGYLNLGTAAFYGIGAYTVAILNHSFGWPPFLTAVLGGLTAVVAAIIIGIPSLRIRGVYFAILTLILTFLVQRLAFSVPITRGALGIFLDPLEMEPRRLEQLFYFIFLGLAALVTLIVRIVENSRFGHALVAIREDEDAAAILGVRTTRTKMYALGMGAFFMGLVGALVAQRVTFIDPDAAFSMTNSINPVIMAMYGGAGYWQGPLIGAPLVVLLGELLRVVFGGIGIFGPTVPAEAGRLIFGAILIGVALYARQGVMGIIRPRKGSRRRI